MRTIQGKTYILSGICCAAEESVVRRKLDASIGAESYRFNPITNELVLQRGVDTKKVIKLLGDAGFGARDKQSVVPEESFWQRHAEAVQTIVAALLTATALFMESTRYDGDVPRALFLCAIGIGGWRVFVKAFQSARSFSLDMNVLMSLAVIGAIAINRWGEAAAVIVLFACSLMLESYSASRTRRAIQALVALSPEKASVLRDGKEVLVPAKDVDIDEVLLIRPGERVPLDGTVVDGISSVNESLITGESVPAHKNVGSVVFAGSINERGSLRVKVTARAEGSTLARIAQLVQQSQEERAPIQSFVDRFAQIYTPIVLGLAVLVASVPPLVWSEPWGVWVYRSLVLLVIACPCALVISTPVTVVSAVTNAARRGMLIKGGKYIEVLSKVRAIAFDKTGTLTEGKPRVTNVVTLNSMHESEILSLVAAMEYHSEHHLASAVLAEAERRDISYADIPVEHFESVPGMGVRARVNDHIYYLGNHQMCEANGYCSSLVEITLDGLAREGKTAIVLGRDREALGIVAIRDTAREQSREAIERLKHMGMEEVLMISGDHEGSVRRVAEEIGVDRTAADTLPAQKVEIVKQLKTRYGTVAMVGDGVNDAPALAASSVGIAMGGNGSDAALETADVVLMSDDLSKLPGLFGLSRKAMKIIMQNIALALSLKLVFLLLGVFGVATLWMAVLADDGAALIVILNGLRALTFWKPA